MSTPLQFVSISLRNFLSFGNQVQEIDLSNYGSTLIIGENLDANSNNGAGKTTIINALCYALYNKPFDSISLQRIINSTNAVKNTLMEIRLIFRKGEDEYEIYRCRGENYNIQFFKNGDDITPDSVAASDALIEETIGISFELFTKIVIFSGNSIPFLLMAVSQQRNQIEELFNITMLSEKAVRLKEFIKESENGVSVQEAIIREQEGQQTLHKKQLEAAETRVTNWDIDRTRQIRVLTADLESMSAIDMEQEKELHTLLAEVDKDLAALTQKRNALNEKLKRATRESSKISEEITHLHDDKCPYCKQGFAGAAEKLAEKEDQLERMHVETLNIQGELHHVEPQVAELQATKSDASGLINFKNLAEAVRAETTAKTAQQKIDDLTVATNPHIEALEQLKTIAVKDISYSLLDDLKKDIEHQQFLLKLLTDKNSFIRRKIISRTIPFLNKQLTTYTKDLGLPHIVRFDDDMSCTVTEYGRELDFGNLSSGEKKRVNLSLSLAFRDVLHHLHARVNSLFIDEIDASLDGSGVDNVFKLLKNKARDDGLGLWIISHRPEAVGRFDRSLTIRKENGFSRIVDDEGELA